MSIYLVKKKNLSEEVVGKIKTFMVNSSMKPGDRLPTENELAVKFGVSRNIVREATKALSFLGIINSAPRRGLSVGEVDMHRLAEYLGFHFALSDFPKEHLLHARIVIETGALPYTMDAMHRSSDLREKLFSISEELTNEEDSDKYLEEDMAFHRALVEASGIEPLVAFNDLLQVFFTRFRQSVETARRMKAYSVENHRNILDALCYRKLALAQELLRQHLEYHKDAL
jgi:GntR family transcriptional regulator, transcriptional repressor for pyruvate dehydrogenase complex